MFTVFLTGDTVVLSLTAPCLVVSATFLVHSAYSVSILPLCGLTMSFTLPHLNRQLRGWVIPLTLSNEDSFCVVL